VATAVIGDQLRKLAAWCQFGACIARYTNDAALGEADLRARAMVAGWRVDALGRLACPRCQQLDSSFWTTRPLQVWTPVRGPATWHEAAPPRAAGAHWQPGPNGA
jgi:hypothetical protein